MKWLRGITFSFSEVDADINLLEFVVAGIAGVALIAAPLMVQALLANII